jgi:hypothetical protein
MVDVYGGVCDTNGHGACPYPAPYGGQGQNINMDMVWPQKLVCLFAKVTYNLWPIQDKVVTFRITGPLGGQVNFTYIDTSETDKDGIANITFRMPWEGCSHPEDYFGVYEVTVSLDLYCQLTIDKLRFHYDYAVHFFSVTTNKYYYNHLEVVKVTVTFGTYAMQKLFPVKIYGALKDELGQPLTYGNEDAYEILAGWGRYQWCVYKNYTVVLEIPIPKWAVAGYATVHVNLLCAQHGYAWCPSYTPYPKIVILPA